MTPMGSASRSISAVSSMAAPGRRAVGRCQVDEMHKRGLSCD